MFRLYLVIAGCMSLFCFFQVSSQSWPENSCLEGGGYLRGYLRGGGYGKNWDIIDVAGWWVVVGWFIDVYCRLWANPWHENAYQPKKYQGMNQGNSAYVGTNMYRHTHTQVSQTYYYLAHVHIRLKMLFWFGEPDHEVLSSACWNFESCCKAFAAPRSMTCKNTSFDPHKVEGLNLSSGGVKRGQKKISTCKKMQIYSGVLVRNGLGLILVRAVMMAKSWRRVAHDIFYALRDLWNFAARHCQPSNSLFFGFKRRPACMLCCTQGKLGRRRWQFQPEGGHLASGAIPPNRRQRDRKIKRHLDKAHHAFQPPWAKLAAGFSRRRPATTAFCCIVARRGSAEARKGRWILFPVVHSMPGDLVFWLLKGPQKKN